MKKPLLLLSLFGSLFGAGTAVEADAAVEMPASGYYQIVCKGGTARKPYLFSDDFYAANTNKYTLLAAAPVTTNNGIWKISVDGNALTVVNGQGTHIKSDNGLDTSTLHIKTDDTTNDGAYFFTESLNCSAGTLQVLGDYTILTTYVGTSVSNQWCRWNIVDANVDESHVYNVEITGAEGAHVTWTHNASDGTTVSENAYNGGFFISSTAPDASELSASTVEGYEASVNVSANTITVTYAVPGPGFGEQLQALVGEAETALKKVGVGYPVAGHSARGTLSDAIATAKAVEAANVSEADVNALETAINDYKSVTDNIQMPEDGKAYTFTALLQDGRRRLMWYNATDGSYYMNGAGSTPTDAELAGGILVCRKLGEGQYAFVNNAGKYFIWRGAGSQSAYGNNKGFLNAYEADKCVMTIHKFVKADSQTALFGCMAVRGLRDAVGGTNDVYFTATQNGYQASTSPVFDATNSSALLIEEVDYPNTVSLNPATGIDGVEGIGTFSAPFPTVIPEGVRAFYVSAEPDENNTIALTAVTSQAIPASTGVVLTGSSETAVMLPATTEEAATIEGNKLGNTAGVARAIASSDTQTAYILSDYDNVVGFYKVAAENNTLAMNKAYLLLDKTVTATAALRIGFDKTTAIGQIETTADGENPVIYDLAGRRVAKAVKGLYIVNGKKVLVK